MSEALYIMIRYQKPEEEEEQMKQVSHDEAYKHPQTSLFSTICENEDKQISKTGIQKMYVLTLFN